MREMRTEEVYNKIDEHVKKAGEYYIIANKNAEKGLYLTAQIQTGAAKAWIEMALDTLEHIPNPIERKALEETYRRLLSNINMDLERLTKLVKERYL